MSKAPLTQTTIVDKNGVTTTRFKRTSARTASSTNLPAPAVKKTRSTEEVQTAFTKLGYRESSFTLALRERISDFSEEEYFAFNALMDAPPTEADRRGDRSHSAAAILAQPSGHTWKLYGAMILARGSTLCSTVQLPLLTMLSNDERYAKKIRALNAAGPEFERQICNIASAITNIVKAEEKNFSPNMPSWEKNVFMRQNGAEIIFRNPEVVEAMLSHPDNADVVADLFLERGKVDTIDAAIGIAPALRDGAL